MSKILISPYPANLYNGQPSPKRYPHWPKLVALLTREGYEVIQIGINRELRIEGVSEFIADFPFCKLRDLANECATWIAVDNFWQHFVHCERLRGGLVLWGPSDPRIFGYPENVNLLRGRDYLRPNQYQTWTEWTYNPAAFVYAENVMPHVTKLAPLPLKAYQGIY